MRYSIVGRGNNSKGGVPKIRPAVTELCRELNLRVLPEENPGRVYISLTAATSRSVPVQRHVPERVMQTHLWPRDYSPPRPQAFDCDDMAFEDMTFEDMTFKDMPFGDNSAFEGDNLASGGEELDGLLKVLLLILGGGVLFYLFSQSSEDGRAEESQEPQESQESEESQESSFALILLGSFIFVLLFIPSLSWTFCRILFYSFVLYIGSQSLKIEREGVQQEPSLSSLILSGALIFLTIHFLVPLGLRVLWSVFSILWWISQGVLKIIFFFVFWSIVVGVVLAIIS